MSQNEQNPARQQDETFAPLQQHRFYQEFRTASATPAKQEIEPDWQACAHCGTAPGDAVPRLRQSPAAGRGDVVSKLRPSHPAAN